MLANLISECEPPGTSSGATARNTTLPQSSAAVKKLLKGAAAAELFHYLQQHATDGRTSPVKNSAPISTNSGNHTNTSFPLEYNKISLKNGRVADENAAISSPSASSPSRGVSSLALLNLLKHAADDSRRSFDLRTSQTALNNQFWRKEDTAPPAPSHESFEYRHQHRIPTKQHHKISSVSNHSIFHNNSSNSGETEVMPSSMLAASPNNEVVFGRTTAAVSKQQGNVATLLGQQSSSCISNNASSTAKSTMKSNRSRGLLQSEESLVCGVKTGNNVSSALNSSVLPTNSSPRRRVMKSHEDETRTRFAIDFNSVDFLRGSQMKELIRSKEVESASMYTTSKPLSMCVMMNMEPRVYRSRPHTLQQEFQADRTTVSIALGGGLAK